MCSRYVIMQYFWFKSLSLIRFQLFTGPPSYYAGLTIATSSIQVYSYFKLKQIRDLCILSPSFQLHTLNLFVFIYTACRIACAKKTSNQQTSHTHGRYASRIFLITNLIQNIYCSSLIFDSLTKCKKNVTEFIF